MSRDDAEGFLSRWSRRKRDAVAEPAPSPDQPLDAPAEPPAEPGVAPMGTGPMGTGPSAAAPIRAACPIPNLPEIDLASLPRIEDLTAESDFALFLRPGIPSLLRNAALRRMWSLDPAIRDYVGPLDYQWDFNTPGGLPFGFSNELGGDVAKLLAQAVGQIEKLAEDPPEAGAEPGPSPAEPPALAEQPVSLVAEAPAPELGPPELGPPELGPPEPGPVPRRRHGGALPA